MIIRILGSEKAIESVSSQIPETGTLTGEPALNGQEFWKFIQSKRESYVPSKSDEYELSLEEALESLKQLG